MDNNTPFILGKIYGKPEYAEALLRGSVYINPLASFGAGNLVVPQKEMTNKYRGDLNEGLLSNTDVNNLSVYNQSVQFFQDIGGIPRGTSSVGEIDTRFLGENIFCLTALFYDDVRKQLIPPDQHLMQFDDNGSGLAIIIFDVHQFIKRILKTLSEAVGSPYWFAYGLVDYDFDFKSNRESDEFTKEKSFDYQQEFRIAINFPQEIVRIRKNSSNVVYSAEKGTLQINIGSISDIAFVLPVKDYIALHFPPEYRWIISSQPQTTIPFYPPIKSETSYICPLLRIKDTTFISDKALYPVIRDKRAFWINQHQLEKTLLSHPSNNVFFMSVMEIYCKRLMDIYKSMNDFSKMEEILTALMYYFLPLGIQRCAGIHFIPEGDGVRGAYDDLDIHDISLLEPTTYRFVHKHQFHLEPTDFAAFITLSEQTVFPEFEYNGQKYVRVVASRDGTLPSGQTVKKGEAQWFKVGKVRFVGF